MTLSFAGVPLPLSTPELEQWLAQVQPLDGFRDSELWNFAGTGLELLPTPPWPKPPRIRPGVLHWPTGAVNAAWFHAVVGQDQVDAIRTAVGSPQTPKPLVMSDGRTGKTVTASMYLLPFRPLSQFGTDPTGVAVDGWLLTLCDQRFFWWYKYADVIPNDIPDWGGFLGRIGDKLGITVTRDTVDAAYTPPTEKWLGRNRPLATVLDAAAAQVGQRVVCLLDGTVKTVNWDTAKDASDLYTADVSLLAGGFLSPTDTGKMLPENVVVYFASGGGGCCPDAPYTQSKPLSTLTASALFSGSPLTGRNGVVYGDAIYDGTNAGPLSDYAAAAATAWYGWRSADTDLVFPGIEPWVPTGWEEYAEWTYQKREDQPFASTTVRRGEWDALPSGSWEVGDCCEFFVEVTGGSESAGYSGFRVVLLGPNNWVAATSPEPLEFEGNIWRAKSNETESSGRLPPIEPTQLIRVWRSPTYGPVAGVPQYEALPWGAQTSLQFDLVTDVQCIGSTLTVTKKTLRLWARDLIGTLSGYLITQGGTKLKSESGKQLVIE